MGFFSKLLGKNDWKETLVKDLTVLTAVDGDMDKEEVSLVYQIAINELGFTEQKFISLMENLESIKDFYPTEVEDKIEYIKYLLQITYADGFIDDNEIDYMKKIAQRMKLPASSIDNAISHIEQSANQNNTDVKLTYISTIDTTMGIEFDEIEDPDDVQMKSIDFTKSHLKINGSIVSDFILYENTPIIRSWLTGEEGEAFSSLFSVDTENKEVKHMVILPSVVGVVKPSVRTFTYESDMQLRDFPIDELNNNIEKKVTLDFKRMSSEAIKIALGISRRIKSFGVAKQFVLEESEAASLGNDIAKNFVKNSGITESEYIGAMRNSFEKVDRADDPQEFIIKSCMLLADMDLKVKTRIEVVDYIMRKWKIGKYA